VTADEIRKQFPLASFNTADGREIHFILVEIAAQLAELNENLRLARGMKGDPR